jgi:hypothetical protein
MKSINQELLSLVNQETQHLDTFVAGRAARHNLKLSGPASNTIISTSGESIINIEVKARMSIRFRDGGFRRGWHKGVRASTSTKRKNAKSKPPKRANIINRLMFAMTHHLIELGILRVADVTVTNLKENLK